jgi:hypothetical protein
MQMLGTGSGRSSQQPYQLIFGLGDLDQSVDVHFEVRPYTNNLDWVFTWETDHWTEPGEDVVTIEIVSGSDCAFNNATLQDGVTTRLHYQVDPDTQAVTYRHEVRWDNRPCVTGCSYSYDVESSLGATSDSVLYTETDLIRFTVCPSSIQGGLDFPRFSRHFLGYTMAEGGVDEQPALHPGIQG